MIIPVFLPHLGCGDRCVYCDQNIITDIGEVTLRERIERSLANREGPVEVGLYGGNIFGIPPEVLRHLFSLFSGYRNIITNFTISTKPVPLDDEVMFILKQNQVTTIELGIPSFNDTILEVLNRKHTKKDLRKAFQRLTKEGFRVALQVMVGLPYETIADIAETIENINQLNPAFIRIYPLALINGTPLAGMYEAKQFLPIPFGEAIYRAMLIHLSALQHEIKTVKMGLTDNEVMQDKIIGGYYHPAFGFLVKSEAYYRAVLVKMAKTGFKGEVSIFINERDISHLLGHKRNNIKRFHDAGISVTWQIIDTPPGTFMLRSTERTATGTIFDALMEVPEMA
jgi:histone acetyltransferase (RNA polymerase elongator complex component)